MSESHRTVITRSSRQCGSRVVLMGSTIYGQHHMPSLIHIAGELVNSEDVNVTPTTLCGSPYCRLETEFLPGSGHPWRSVEKEFSVVFAQPDWSSHGAVISEMQDGRSDLRWFQSA